MAEEEEWADSEEDGGDISDDGDKTDVLLAQIRRIRGKSGGCWA